MIALCHAIANLDGSFAEADEAYCQMMQLTPAELCKRDVLSMTHPADRAQNSASLHRLIDQGTPFWIRKRYIRDDGGIIWVLNHVSQTNGVTGKTRLAAASFVLPVGVGNQIGGVGPESLAEQAETLKKLL